MEKEIRYSCTESELEAIIEKVCKRCFEWSPISSNCHDEEVITAQELASEARLSNWTILERVRGRKIPLVKKRPVTFQRKYIPEILGVRFYAGPTITQPTHPMKSEAYDPVQLEQLLERAYASGYAKGFEQAMNKLQEEKLSAREAMKLLKIATHRTFKKFIDARGISGVQQGKEKYYSKSELLSAAE